ncbi:MAG: DUF4258 domain-containing protein [Armatimonadetes bacterium]|nr:DUF4258 domain-containing protein [Armatimonadota bacterium]
MPVDKIREDVLSGRITFGPHLVERMYQNGMSIDQVTDTILTGSVSKQEFDERSLGKFTKYTISKRRVTVTVKDCRPAFIITANRR